METAEWKKLKNVDKLFQNIIVDIANFSLTITKSQSFPIIADDYRFVRNLYFGCNMLEVICGNRRMKKNEKCR